MEETTTGKQSLKQSAYRSKREKKKSNTDAKHKEHQKDKNEDVKKRLKIIECGEGK